MTTVNDNAKLAKNLKDSYTRETGKTRNIKLPQAIQFTIHGTTVRMRLDSACVEANMQDDPSAFEGWSLALKRWLPNEVAQVELSWAFEGNAADPHYQRFLFRAQQFRLIFPAWFSVASANACEMATLKTGTAGPYIVSAAKQERETLMEHRCACMAEALGNEHKLECFIKDNPKPLMAILGLSQLDRQYPVGIFAGSVGKGNEVFPRGHSAIDLWGTSKTDLFLFELKAEGNVSMGIMSELFFYSYVVEGIQQGRYNHKTADVRITSTNAVRAYILAPDWHPLIDEKLLSMVNAAFSRSGQCIGFGAVKIVPEEVEKYRVVARA